MEKLYGLEPKKVFKYFEEISQIPRGSGNEKAISDYMVKFAKERNLYVVQDSVNNILIKKEGTVGYETVSYTHLVTVCKEEALKRAEQVQKGIDDGTISSPLAGVPMARCV